MATTNLLQWNPAAANQETDAAYLADSTRADGAVDPTIFLSVLANKAFFQWSTYLTALFTAFAAKGFTTSDSNLSTLTAQCAHFLTSADVIPGLQEVAFSPSLSFNAAAANGFQVAPMTSNLTITSVTGTTAGQLIAIYLQQDGVGGRTVTYPSQIVGAAQPDVTPGILSLQLFRVEADAVHLTAAGPMMSSNGSSFQGSLKISGGGLTVAGAVALANVLTVASSLNVDGIATFDIANIDQGNIADAAVTTLTANTASVNTTLGVGGTASLGALQVAGGAAAGSVLIGNGTTYVPRTRTLRNVTGSRAFGTTAPQNIAANGSNADLEVFATGLITGSFGQGFALALFAGPTSGGQSLVAVNGVSNDQGERTVSGVVPYGWFYSVVVFNGNVSNGQTPTLSAWLEAVYV
jgi:hypothetical protein